MTGYGQYKGRPLSFPSPMGASWILYQLLEHLDLSSVCVNTLLRYKWITSKKGHPRWKRAMNGVSRAPQYHSIPLVLSFVLT